MSARLLLRARRVLLALLVSALLMPPAIARAESPGAPDPYRVLVDEGGDGLSVILDTCEEGEQRSLTLAEDALGPAWSPDGDRVAFWRRGDDREDNDDTVLVVGAEGGAPETVTAGASPSWSPDGTRLVVSRTRLTGEPGEYDYEGGLVIVDLLTGEERALPGDGALSPRWSPDGTHIASVTSDPVEGVLSASVKNVATGQSRSVTDLFVTGTPVWSPDGQSLAFGASAVFDPPERRGVWTFSLASGEERQLVRTTQAPHVAWSPDGTRIAFDDADGDRTAVRTVGLDGRVATLASSFQSFAVASWSADAATVATTVSYPNSDRPDELRVVGEDGYRTLPARPGRFAEPTFEPGLALRRVGATRIETALSVSRTTFESATALVLARADEYADALAGGPLAAAVDGPLLLTGSASLPSEVAAEIVRLAPDRVLLLGGTAALSEDIERQVAELGATPERVAGPDRFGTAAAIADRLGPVDAAVLVEGINADPARGWPDAVSAGWWAAQRGVPVLLTSSDELPAATRDALRRLRPQRVDIVGGRVAVTENVAADVDSLVETVERIAGADRYETSQMVRARVGGTSLWVATGRDWPDALTAAPALARAGERVGLVLVDGADAAHPSTQGALFPLTEGRPDGGPAVLLGGPAALDPVIDVRLERAARGVRHGAEGSTPPRSCG